MGKAAPPQGRAVGLDVRGWRVGAAAGRRLLFRHLPLAGTEKQFAAITLIVGLPIVLTLAWYHGDKGQQRITRDEVAILTLLFLLGGGLFWYYQRTSIAPEAQVEARSAHPSAATPADLPNDRSIAVLPFVNMSADKEQEYFADGISEEVLNLLTQVPQLRVIARTSSFSFKGKEADIAEIAKKLNVATRARRQRPQVGRHGAHHGAADPCFRQFASVVGDLRSQAHRCVRGAGRDRGRSRHADEGHAAR